MITPQMSNQNAIAAAIFLVLIAVTISTAIAVRFHFDGQSQEAFEDVVEVALVAVEEDINKNLAELTAIQGFFNSTSDVSRKQFDTFVSMFFLAESGTQALEWIPRVPRDQRDVFIQQVREEGFEQFTIHPPTDLEVSFPVNYVFPFEPNLAAFGFDLASNKSRLAALQQARDSGALVATEPITLVQETGEQAGFLVFAPIYSTGDVPASLQQRRETLRGFGLAVFRVGDFIGDAIPENPRSRFNLRVADSVPGMGDTVIHSNSQAFPKLSGGQGIEVIRTVDVAGRQWNFEFAGPSGFGISGLSRLMWIIVLVAGGILSILTLGVSYLLLNGRNRAVAYAENMNRSLIESESERAQMFELSQDLIITADREGKFVFVSGAARTILGREPSEMMGAPYLDFIHPDDHDTAIKAARDAFEGKQLDAVEIGFLRADGGVASIEWQVTTVPDPSGVIFAVGRDITQRKAALEEIGNLAKFPSENPNPVARFSAGGIIMYANDAAKEVLESPNMKAGQPTLEYWQEMVKETLASGSSKDVEIDYGSRVFSYSVVPVAETGYVNVYGRDITAAKEVDRMKDEFISVASHELRTPVTSIKGFVELLAEEQTGPLNQEQRQFLEAVNRNTVRLEKLVNDLLDISRLDTGTIVLDRSAFALKEVVQQAIVEMSSEIDAKSLKIHTTATAPEIEIEADRSRTLQILANLLSNAVKYSPPGSSVDIDLTSLPDGDFVQVNVRDHGPGVAEEDKEKLFQKFFRADNSTTRSTAGTGLGLAIAKALVELQGGEIWVRSQTGEGSTFSFTLPTGSEPI